MYIENFTKATYLSRFINLDFAKTIEAIRTEEISDDIYFYEEDFEQWSNIKTYREYTECFGYHLCFKTEDTEFSSYDYYVLEKMT